MVNSILLENLNTQTLKELIKDSVKELFKDNSLKSQLQELNTHNPDELLTRTETCKFLQIDSSTLWHWTNKGKVKAYGIGNRRYYKKAELLESLKPLNK
jgi:predicted oxidoreductase